MHNVTSVRSELTIKKFLHHKGKVLKKIITILFAIFLATTATAQQEYGQGDWSRSDCFTKDGLIEHWNLDPGTRGDSAINGDFENWTSGGSCFECPTDWNCACTGTTTLAADTTYIYKTNTSITSTGAAGASSIYFEKTFEANQCYQLSLKYRGGVGGVEDFQIRIVDAGNTDYYNFATDAWQAGATQQAYTNIPATWTATSLFVRTGAAVKTDYRIYITTTSTHTFYFDDFKIEELFTCDIYGIRRNALTNPVGSDPLWGAAKAALQRVGTGPAGWWGMLLDGSNDYVECADGDCEMDPVNWESGGLFSVACRVMTDTVAAGSDYIISKYLVAGNQRSWRIYRNATSLIFAISDDGINVDTNSIVSITANVLQSFVSTFDPSDGSGACINNLYYNAYQTDTDATMTECIPFDSTSALQIGANNNGADTFDGGLFECTLWDGVLSAIDANKYISPYFPGNNNGDGFYVDTCTQAASHSTCSTQKCRDGTPNACQAEGTGVIANFGEYTEVIDNNSYETRTGTDDNPAFTGWTEIANVGDGGRADLTAYRADTKHGDISMRMNVKGGDTAVAYISMTSPCHNIAPGSTVYAEIAAKALEGDTSIRIWVLEYAMANCVAAGAGTWVVNDVEATSEWKVYGGPATLTGSAASVSIEILARLDPGEEGSLLVDTASLKVADYHTPWVHNPAGDVTTTYNLRNYRLHNPLSDYVESEDGFAYESGFCASTWVYTDWSEDGIDHCMFRANSTAGNNNKWRIEKTSADNTMFWVWDLAGNNRYVYLGATNTTWTIGDWKYIEVCSNNSDNVVKGHWYNAANQTWYDMGSLGGPGTGVQDDQSNELHIGHRSNMDFLDGYQNQIFISPYSDIYPMKGFNSGSPPCNDGKMPY